MPDSSSAPVAPFGPGVEYVGQQNRSHGGLAPTYSPEHELPSRELIDYQNARSRTHEATADVNLSADWSTFREQLERLEERLLAEPERPEPPPQLYGCAYWLPHHI
jgi:hypothetical protein